MNAVGSASVDRPPPVKVSLRLTGDEFDLVVIGMGSGGILATELAAHDLGLRVAAVDRSRFGGDCLWTGCVPAPFYWEAFPRIMP
jgi:pyruvate/2-oxoglutarate dehydrogenase complex dihydrolipoamide dehydrogenase (E3) component